MDKSEVSHQGKKVNWEEKIAKIDQEIAEQKETASRLKQQSENLKEKVDKLSIEVNDRIPEERKSPEISLRQGKHKKPQYEDMPPDIESKQIQTYTKEIKNAEQQLKYYQKELHKAQGSTNGENPVQQIIQLEENITGNLLKDSQLIFIEKDKEIDQVQQDIKKLEKSKREFEKQIQKLQSDSDIVQKLNSLRKESAILLDKISKLDKKKIQDEKTQADKQEAMTKIQENCEKLGISPTAEYIPSKQPKVEQQKSVKNAKLAKMTVKEIRQVKDNLDNLENNEKNYKELKHQIKIIADSMEKQDKYFLTQKKRLEEQLQKFEIDRDSYQERLKEKEKEKEMAESKYGEYKKLVRSKQLVPIESKSKPDLLNDSKVSKESEIKSQYSRKEQSVSNSQVMQKQQYLLNTGKRGTQRQIIGSQGNNSKATVIDDIDALGDKNIDHFLTKITFYHKEGVIVGFQGEYFSNGEIVDGLCCLDQGTKDECEKEELEIEIGDQIMSVQSTYTDSSVTSIEISTSGDKRVKVGEGNEEDQQFEQTFETGQMVITLFSGTEENALVFWGFEIKNE